MNWLTQEAERVRKMTRRQEQVTADDYDRLDEAARQVQAGEIERDADLDDDEDWPERDDDEPGFLPAMRQPDSEKMALVYPDRQRQDWIRRKMAAWEARRAKGD